jgi:hypothetical protein
MTRHLGYLTITLLLAACSGSSETPDAGGDDGGAVDGAGGDAIGDASADLPVIPTSRFAVGDSNTTTNSESIASAVDVDVFGNSYLAGWYGTGMTLGGKTLKHGGDDGAFAAKLDPQGKVLWLTGATGIGEYGRGFRSMAVGPKGDTFVAGCFDGKATFGSTTHSTTTEALFVARLDASGKYVWVRQFDFASASSGPGHCSPVAMAADASGLVVAGSFPGTLKLGTTTLTSASTGWGSAFVVRLDASGNPLWARTVGGSSSLHTSGRAVAIDGQDVLVAGFFEWADAVFDGTTLKLKDKGLSPSSGEGGDLFVARLDDKGKYLWAVSAGSSTPTRLGTHAEGLAVDASGAAYVTGYHQGSVAFGKTTLTTSSTGEGSTYVARLDTKGSWVWATPGGGRASGVAVDPAGKVHVVGSFSKSATFGKRTINAQASDVFVAWLDDKGTFLNAMRGGGQGQDEGHAVAADHAGNTYVAGSYRDKATFDTTTLPAPQGSFSHAALIWKLVGK